VEVECRRYLTERPKSGARAFVKGPNPLLIVVCANRIFSRSDMEQVLVHELIHMQDVRLLGMELRSCTEFAYSEIRAACEAECYNCIQKRATVATNNLFPKNERPLRPSNDAFGPPQHSSLSSLHPSPYYTSATQMTGTTQTPVAVAIAVASYTTTSHHTSPFSATDDTINGQPYQSSYSAEFTAKTASTFSS
jgi:hypothetical protein